MKSQIEKLNIRFRYGEVADVDEVNRIPAKVDEIIDALDEGVGGDKFDEMSFSNVNIGGLASGDDISGKTAVEVLDMIINPEYAPKWTEPSVIAKASPNVFEVGSEFDTTCVKSTITDPKAESSAGTATSSGRIVGVMFDDDELEQGDVIGSEREIQATVVVNFAAGTTIVKSSKGNPTNKTADNGTTLLANASVNQNIDGITYKLKDIRTEGTCTLYYVYPIFAATGGTIGNTLVKQSLQTSKTYTLSMPQETSAIKHSFSVPSGKRVSVKIFNSLSSKYEDYAMSNFNVTTEKIVLGGSEVTYNRYTRNDGTNGKTQFQITIS